MLDKPDLLVARAPKPTQLLLTTEDQYFPLVGGKAAVAEAAPVFTALADGGAKPGLVHTVGVNVHGYVNSTRLALYAFMVRALQGRADSGIELPVKALSFEQMRATSTGSVLTDLSLNAGQGSVTAHKAFVAPIAASRLSSLRRARTDAPRSLPWRPRRI